MLPASGVVYLRHTDAGTGGLGAKFGHQAAPHAARPQPAGATAGTPSPPLCCLSLALSVSPVQFLRSPRRFKSCSYTVCLASLIAATHGCAVGDGGMCSWRNSPGLPYSGAACWEAHGVAPHGRSRRSSSARSRLGDDFTEDLLEALTTDDEPLVDDEPAVVVPGAAGVALLQLESYTNAESISAMRSSMRCMRTTLGQPRCRSRAHGAHHLHAKHLQANKKDYASLRGLTAMVTRRRKLLEYLLREDLNEFNRITEELGIRTSQFLKPKLTGARGRRVRPRTLFHRDG